MFRITQDPSSGSDNPFLIKLNKMVQMCLLCALSVFGCIFWTCGVCVRAARTHHMSRIKYGLAHPDDGSCVIRNTLE
jgi:hypothetical protein